MGTKKIKWYGRRKKQSRRTKEPMGTSGIVNKKMSEKRTTII